ncbi:potassium channel family protein [Alphaproteobacteria bacterium]|nr:potassium channel family protein [Alphaproteobacteria bacterium]
MEYKEYFIKIELFFSVFSAIEYIFRVSFSGTESRYRGFRGKFKYVITPIVVVDFLSFAPTFIFVGVTGTFLLRILRLIWLLRIVNFLTKNRPIFLFIVALKNSKSQLVGTLVVALFVLFVGAILLYLIEGHVQPEVFGSIPRAMWWSMETLTTVGYGDAYPITAMGKLMSSIIALLGIGIVALPAGIIAVIFF